MCNCNRLLYKSRFRYLSLLVPCKSPPFPPPRFATAYIDIGSERFHIVLRQASLQSLREFSGRNSFNVWTNHLWRTIWLLIFCMWWMMDPITCIVNSSTVVLWVLLLPSVLDCIKILLGDTDRFTDWHKRTLCASYCNTNSPS